MKSGNWKAIERLPDVPGVAKMVHGGYWLNGKFYASDQRQGQRKGVR